MQHNEVNIAELMPAERWREEKGHVLFATKPSLEWFLRKHAEELVSDGVLLKINRKWFVTPSFDGAAVQRLREDTLKYAQMRTAHVQ